VNCCSKEGVCARLTAEEQLVQVRLTSAGVAAGAEVEPEGGVACVVGGRAHLEESEAAGKALSAVFISEAGTVKGVAVGVPVPVRAAATSSA